MKKTILMLISVLLLTACSGKKALHKEKLELYQSYWTVIQDQETYLKESQHFGIRAELDENGDYAVIVDKARVAMMDVEILVIENQGPFQTEKMMPSAGIFEDAIDLVPNQSKPESDFKAGIKVGGTAELPLTLHVLVSWKSLTDNENYREFFEFELEAEETETEDDKKESEESKDN